MSGRLAHGAELHVQAGSSAPTENRAGSTIRIAEPKGCTHAASHSVAQASDRGHRSRGVDRRGRSPGRRCRHRHRRRGEHAAPLGRAASRDNGVASHLISLGNGATASATLRIVEAGDFATSACRPVTAAGLRVYPPNQTAAKYVPFPFSACSRTGPTYLSVQAVTH
jgi:hypothetical protein